MATQVKELGPVRGYCPNCGLMLTDPDKVKGTKQFKCPSCERKVTKLLKDHPRDRRRSSK